jgi:hypothetical protein
MDNHTLDNAKLEEKIFIKKLFFYCDCKIFCLILLGGSGENALIKASDYKEVTNPISV